MQPPQAAQYRALASPPTVHLCPSQSAPLDLLPGPWQPLTCSFPHLSLLENFTGENYTVCIPCVWLLSLRVSFWDFPMSLCVSVICFSFFNSWVVFHCLDVPQCAYLFTSWRTFGLCLTCGCQEWAAAVSLYKSLFGNMFLFLFVSSWGAAGFARSHGKYMFNFRMNCSTVFRLGCTISHFQQQCMRVTCALHPCQYWIVFSPF